MGWLDRWKHKARELKIELMALYLAARDPRVPWYARVTALCIVGYAFSPIDLIPDPIPILGYLDDMVLLPLGILLVRRLIPAVVLEECRQQAREATDTNRPTNWIAAVAVVIAWIVLAVLAVILIRRWV